MKITRKTVINTAIVLAMVFLVAAMVLPALTAKWQKSHKDSTISDLHCIFLAIAMYSIDYSDHLPVSSGYEAFNFLLAEGYMESFTYPYGYLSALVGRKTSEFLLSKDYIRYCLPKKEVSELKFFIADNDKITSRPTRKVKLLASENNTTYAYLGNGLTDLGKLGKTPIVLAKPWLLSEPHYVLFADRKVTYFYSPDKQLKTCEEAINYLAENKLIDTDHVDKILANAREIDKNRVNGNEK